MTQVASLDTVMRLNSAAFNSGMQQAAQQAVASLRQIQTEAASTASVMDTMRQGLVLWAAIDIGKNIFESLVNAQVQLQSIHYTLLSATGSSNDAAGAMDFLRAEADRLGLSLPQAAEGFAKLSAAATASGVSMKDQQSLFDAFAKASTTLHLSTEASGRALLALQEMFSRGTVQARQLNQQLGQAIPGSAARFKNAVEEMTRGTDLQGKSFESLMKSGQLVTAQFLPALVTALNGAGTGWQDASTGLNANLNRLSTAWFNLKNNISGGLFTDVVSNGAAILASNLDHIATTLTVIAGLAAGRGVATVAGAAADRIQTTYQKQYLGPSMAASAQSDATAADAAAAKAAADVASARALENSMYMESAAASAAYQKQLQFELAGIKDVTVAELERIQSALLLNDALGTGVAAERTKAELTAQLATAENALAIVTTKLASSQVAYNAAVETGNLLQAKQAGLSAEAAVAQSAASTAEVVAANAARAELAIGGIGTAALAAAKSFGSFALALVGGPWGLAVAAIGAIGLAVYDNIKASEEYQQTTKQEAQSLTELTDKLNAAAKGYGTLYDSKTLSQAQDISSSGLDQINKTQQELDDLRQHAAELKSEIQGALSGGNGFAAMGVQKDLDETNSRITALQDDLSNAQSASAALSSQISGGLTVAVKGLKGALDSLQNGGSITDAFKKLASPDDVAAGAKAIEAAKKQMDDLVNGASTQAERLAKENLTHDKGKTFAVQYDLNLALNDSTKQGLSAEKVAQLQDQIKQAFQPVIDAASKYDQTTADKKAAEVAAQQAKAAQTLKDRLDGTNAALQTQLETTSKLTPEQAELAKILAGTVEAYNHATPAVKAQILADAEQNAQLSLKVKAMQQAQKAAEAYAIAEQNVARIEEQQAQAREDALASIGKGSQETSDDTALRNMKRQYDQMATAAGSQLTKGKIDQGTYDREVDLYQQSLNKERDAYLKFTQDRKDAEGNWINGATAAWQNFQDTAANVAGMTQNVFTNAFDGLTTSLTNFVTTGKLNFKSFVTGVMTDLAKMEMQIAESKILSSIISSAASYFGGGAGGYDSMSSSGQVAADVAASGGHAGGGSVGAGQLTQVAEGGRPELYQAHGNTYLIGGAGGGNVVPLQQAGSGGSGSDAAPVFNLSTAINIASDGSAQKQDSAGSNSDATKLAAQLHSVMQREIVVQMQPNGLLWKFMKGQTA